MLFILLLACLVESGFYLRHLWKRQHLASYRLIGNWVWDDGRIFEFEKINFRFTPDSFFLVQRYMDPEHPKHFMPCSQIDHQIYAAGPYFLSGDTLRFRGNFTDSRFSRDTLRLCRDTGFNGLSNFTLESDSLCLKAGAFGKNFCLVKNVPSNIKE